MEMSNLVKGSLLFGEPLATFAETVQLHKNFQVLYELEASQDK